MANGNGGASAPPAVLAAVERGESVIPVNGSKKALFSWKRYQEQPASADEVCKWAKNSSCTGFAVVTGAVSGLVILDFDDADGIALCRRLELEPHVQTPSGGYHVRFRHPGFKVATQNSETTKRLQERWHGCDIRADGGYAVEWGRIKAGEYRALRDLAEAEDLERLPRELLIDLGIAETGTPAPPTEPDERRKVRHPGRHAYLLGIAGAMRGRGEEERAVLAELRRVNKLDCDPPKPDQEVVALAKDVAARYEPDPDRFRVTFTDDRTPKLVLPKIPPRDDTPGLCGWLTSVFHLDPDHPVTAAVQHGPRGPDGHVQVRRAGLPSIFFEPAGSVSTARRLLTQLGWQLEPTDSEPYGFRDEHARRIAHVLRLLCGASQEGFEIAEAWGVVVTFMNDAIEVEGFSTYGATGQRYEAVCALRSDVNEATGRTYGPARYLLDTETGEYVVRVGDLQRTARAAVGSSLPRGWVDSRMELLGWKRLTLEGRSAPGHAAGVHARCSVYRGLLAGDDDG